MYTRIPGINRVRAKGRVYYYHRATGTRLHAEPGSDAFWAELAALAKPATDRPRPDTLNGLIDLYRADPLVFGKLRERTRQDYEAVFAWLKPLGDAPLHRITRKWVKKVRAKAYVRHKTRFANYVRQVLSLLFNWAIEEEHVTENPAARIKKIARDKALPRANRPWQPQERAVVLGAAKGGLRPGIALAMFAGFARGDLIRFPWTGYDGSAIEFIRGKTGARIWMPAHRDLRAILDATPRHGVTVVLARGRVAYTGEGFSSSFRKLIDRLEKAGLVKPGLTIHGLRHTVGGLILDAGGTTKDVQTILGHADPKMSEFYSREFDREKRATATIRRLEKRGRSFAKRT